MRPDIDNIIYILIYAAVLISIIGSLIYFCKEIREPIMEIKNAA